MKIKESVIKIIKYYFGENREDKISLGLAYLGCLFFTHFMIWSYKVYGVWGANPIMYIIKLGGLIN